jgi:hypothetical protein
MGLAETFEPNPDLEYLRFLLGTWRGEGDGEFPTIRPFRYGEEMVVEDVGDAFLLFRQSSWTLPDGAPIHFERGFLRPGPEPGSVELTLAHPLGLAEVGVGVVDETSIVFASEALLRTPTGDPVRSLRRRYLVRDDVLTYEIDMETDGTGLSRHLTGRLQKVPS